MIHYSCRVHVHFPQLSPPKKRLKISSLFLTALPLSTSFLGLSIRENRIKPWSLVGGYYCQHQKNKEREKMKHETRVCQWDFEGHYRNQTPLDTQIFPNRVPTSARAGGTLLAAVISTFFSPVLNKREIWFGWQ